MKNNNYVPNKKRSYFIVFGLLILSFLIVFGGLIFRNFFRQDYPLLFIDANNRLMYITKSDNNKNDIANIDDANIIYANNDTRYLLYTNNNVLYLLDTTVGGIGKKIVSNPKLYGFSSSDKYIYYIDNDDSYYIFNRNNDEVSLIDKNVIKTEVLNDNITIYDKNGKLMYYDFVNDPVEIVSNYYDVQINSDNKLILYSCENNSLYDYYVYNVSTKQSNKVLSSITKLYTNDANYTKFIYTKPSTKRKDISKAINDSKLSSDGKYSLSEENEVNLRNQIRSYIDEYEILGNDIYYQNNNINTLIASNINELYYYDIKNQIYSYTTYYFENGSIDISSYNDIETFYTDFESKKLNSLYFKVSTNEESMAYKNITSDIRINIRNDNEFYLLVKNNDKYNLYYSKISNRQIKLVGEIDTNLISSKLETNYVDGYLFCNYINDHYYLNLVNDGKVKTVGSDIVPNAFEVSEGKDSIYYLKNNVDKELLLYNGIRTSKIIEGVHSFIYINNDLIYVTKDYDPVTKTSDLYRLSNNHLTLIYKNIADWYSPLMKMKEDVEES